MDRNQTFIETALITKLPDSASGSSATRKVAGPHEAFSILWELCCQWLKPKTHSKRKFWSCWFWSSFLLSCQRKQHSENGDEAVALVEDVQKVPGQQVRKGSQSLVVLVIKKLG